MYISSIEIKDIRTIESLKIDLNSKSKSIILSGNNGSGKSTVLRCLAMGIVDEDSAASVLRELPGEFVKKGATEGYIKVYLQKSKNEKFLIFTTIKSLPAFEKVYQKLYQFSNGRYVSISQELFPWEKIFIAGYGAGVRNLGTADYQYYVPIDALYSLFKYDVALQSPELSIRRIIASAREKGKNLKDEGALNAKEMEIHLTSILKRILNLEKKDAIILTATSIEMRSKWGRQELSTLGDGYISTTTWILDLFSWWMLHLKLDHKSILANKTIKGIVLVDELEQHLHPIWQVKIMDLLRNSFPNIQFICSTHSPLVISSEIDVPVLALNKKNPIPEFVNGWLAEDILREVMGLPSSRGIDVKNEIAEYKSLHFKKLRKVATQPELSRLRLLKKQLINKLPNTDPIVEVDEIQNITEFLKIANEKRNKNVKAKLSSEKRN